MSHFGLADYGVFGGMLLISTMIGLHQGKSQKTSAAQFLTGGGNMSTWPVALSMLASFLSSITLMGQPAEVYLYGAQQWVFGLATFFIIPFIGYVTIPFFREKNYFSAYQYFGDRFSRYLQLFASILFTIQMIIYLAVVLYAPALAMHQVTGLNTLLVVSLMYVVCILYTTIGGMKAVVWTDTFQVVVLFISLIAVIFKGTYDIGGVDVVWNKSQEFNRTTFFNWDLSVTERYTFWSSFIGSGFLHMSTYGANQLQIQRYLTVPSIKEARKMLWINTVGWTIVVFMCVYSGLLIFATYSHCDPLASQRITKPDQLFPLYVMETLHIYPGFPGLFISGIFSAGLSTVSTGVNSLAAIWFAELEGTRLRNNLTDRQSGLTVKILAFLFGILSYLVVFIVPYLGGLVPVAVSLSSIFAGSLFGLFFLGIVFPKANTWGATAGLITSVGLLLWMSIGATVSQRNGYKVNPSLPTAVDQCSGPVTLKFSEDLGYAHSFYRVSYTWYAAIAIVTTIVVGIIVSYITHPWCCSKFEKKPSALNKDTTVNNLLLNEKELKIVRINDTNSKFSM